ncbi:hypothetical protein DRE_07385 [Drechslerella stenobrocha 248]|uniref:Uncharacterized protein n=1 Tax=Drechslerella stenobrocha 248 TaxID=1043628 RepID=W7I4R8_9PEZI|nr:hypothetical protein DRE_07385 [Drechslerella stenobrocha 248]
MRRLFRSSRPPPPPLPPSPAPADLAPGSKSNPDPQVAVKKEKKAKDKDKDKDKDKKKKRKPSPALSPYPSLSNIPQLARAADAEALATALAVEVDADNTDAGIHLLLKTAAPPSVDLASAPANLRRGSVLKHPPRLDSDDSSPSSPPLSPRSNSTASCSRPRVHFDVSDKFILDAQWYSHQQRLTITSGNFLHFERPPTATYRFATTTESIHTKGTLLQLVTSPSTDDDKNTWDSTTALPLYAARYHSPNITSTERTIYWEAEVGSLGFSKFSSVDHADGSRAASTVKPAGGAVGDLPESTATPAPATDEGLADIGLSRSISHVANHPVSHRPTGAAVAVGFIVKCVTPDTVPFIRRRSSLRPIDEFPFPSSTAGGGIFWSSDNTLPAKRPATLDPPKQQSNDATPVPTPPTTPPALPTPQKDSKELFRRKSSATGGKEQSDIPCADPKDLQRVPVEVFFVVNGEKKISFSHPDQRANPFDMEIPEYLLGTHDVFPCLCIQGAGVECKTRIGQAVKWRGEGGSAEIPPQDNGFVDLKEAKETPKKNGKWWSHIGAH